MFDSDDDLQKPTEFQELLIQGIEQLRMERRKSRISDTDYARWLGVGQASLSQWINGTRTPELASAIKLSKKLGPKIFDSLGFDRQLIIKDDHLQLIVDNWESLSESQKTDVFILVSGIIDFNRSS